MGIWGTIGAGLSSQIGTLIGARENRRSAREINDANLGQNQGQFREGMDFAQDQFDYTKKQNQRLFDFGIKQFAEQKYLARHGIRTRVKDAQDAGIHPLAALGIPTAGGSPVHIGQQGPGGNAPQPTSGSMQQLPEHPLSALGQAIPRSIMAATAMMESAKDNSKSHGQKQLSQEFQSIGPMFSLADNGRGLRIIPSQDMIDLVSESTTYMGKFVNDAIKLLQEPKVRQKIKAFMKQQYNADDWTLNKTDLTIEPVYNKKQVPVPIK